jgi:hypothetical protein
MVAVLNDRCAATPSVHPAARATTAATTITGEYPRTADLDLPRANHQSAGHSPDEHPGLSCANCRKTAPSIRFDNPRAVTWVSRVRRLSARPRREHVVVRIPSPSGNLGDARARPAPDIDRDGRRNWHPSQSRSHPSSMHAWPRLTCSLRERKRSSAEMSKPATLAPKSFRPRASTRSPSHVSAAAVKREL